MMKSTLKIIADCMSEMGIRYALIEYAKKPIVYPYYTGEYTEQTPINEDGQQDTVFQLTGFTRGSWMELETTKETIMNYFGYEGRTMIDTNGNGVAIMYEGGNPVPTWDEELKKIVINLRVKEWRV